MNAESNWQPTSQAERCRTIDIIRGLALFGVLIVNILSGFRVPLLEHILYPYSGVGSANHLVELLVSGVLEFKALTIFCFLFGVGIAIQVERAERRGTSAYRFLLCRLSWLLALGVAHMFLIWNGDILTLYGVCGLLLIPSIRLPWPALTLLGTALIALPEFVPFELNFPSGQVAASDIASARSIYGDGGFMPILEFRWHETWSLIIPILISVLSRTAGLMYLGMATWRSGLCRQPSRFRGVLVFTLVFSGALGASLTLNEIWRASTGHVLWQALRLPHVDASILLALAYVSGLLLWLTPQRASRLPNLVATGQMALTNYLVQSIVLGFVFYGYGLGLFGRIGSAAGACFGVILYVAQVYLSRVWLARLRFGPAEWLWRSLTYGRRQPMRRLAPLAAVNASRWEREV